MIKCKLDTHTDLFFSLSFATETTRTSVDGWLVSGARTPNADR